MEDNLNGKDIINEEDPEIKNLLDLLTQTYTSSTTHKIKEAEEKLKQFDYVIINKLEIKVKSFFLQRSVL